MPDAVRWSGPFREPIRWHLELGDKVVAKIDANGFDFPFTLGRLIDSPEFERFRLFFSDDSSWPDDDPEFEALCGEINRRGGFKLREVPTGITYQGVCLNHDGKDAIWFRHGDPA